MLEMALEFGVIMDTEYRYTRYQLKQKHVIIINKSGNYIVEKVLISKHILFIEQIYYVNNNIKQ